MSSNPAEALQWYGEQASAAARAMVKPHNTDAMLAILTALSLDAGNRALTALLVATADTAKTPIVSVVTCPQCDGTRCDLNGNPSHDCHFCNGRGVVKLETKPVETEAEKAARPATLEESWAVCDSYVRENQARPGLFDRPDRPSPFRAAYPHC